MPAIIIGRRVCNPKITALRPHEAAFVLRCSELDVRNMLRRGERYARAGQDPEAIIARGALPVAVVAGRRRAEISAVACRAGDDELALLVLASIIEGRLAAPRARSAAESAPDLVSVVGRLY